jgi:Response regulators consisting of a CheY-like receiver domain and a winged-helix DNA-binding domain
VRILIVDDEENLLDQLRISFQRQRYIVETAVDGEEALDKIFNSEFDIIILDIMLPKQDGFSVLKEIRQAGINTPVLMLTARKSVDEKVKALDLGADDYLAKPFSLDELMARVRALLRRSCEQKDAVIRVGNIQLSTATREVLVDGQAVELTMREFSILEFLMYNKNKAVSRFSLAEHVWGDAFDPFSMSNFIDVHIKNIRRKIGDVNGSVIRTIRGVGYMIKDDSK